jgi:hypothetical protein
MLSFGGVAYCIALFASGLDAAIRLVGNNFREKP